MPVDKVLIYPDYRDEPGEVLLDSHLDYAEWVASLFRRIRRGRSPWVPCRV